MAESLRDWNKGDPLSHTHLQEPVAALRRLQGVPGSGVGQFKVNLGEWRFAVRVGKIVSAGPDGQSDYGDERYWVQSCYLESDADIDDQVTYTEEDREDDEDFDTVPTIFTVTNLPELASHSHSLVVGQFVWYFEVFDGQDTPKPHKLMSEGSPGLVNLLISSKTADGIYEANIVKSNGVAVDPSASLTSQASTIFNAGGATVIVLNTYSLFSPAFDLLIGGYYLGLFFQSNPDGSPVYIVNGLKSASCGS